VETFGHLPVLAVGSSTSGCLPITQIIANIAPRIAAVSAIIFLLTLVLGRLFVNRKGRPLYRYWSGLGYNIVLRLSLIATIISTIITVVIVITFPPTCYSPLLF
jgi:hypothetical protein